MSKGSYENVASAEDYQFADPTGQFQGQIDQFNNMAQFGKAGLSGAFSQDMQGPQFGDSNAAYNQFLGQTGGLSNLAMGPNAQLTQQLNAIAARQAGAGMQNAATQFQGMGAGRSGAANRAMGEAAANPFADVAAQQQQNQLNLTGNLWNQAFGQAGQQQLQGNELTNQNIMQQNQLQNALLRQRAQTMGSIYGQGMQGAGQMTSQMGGMMAPQYEYQPSPWENFMSGTQDVMGLGMNAASTLGGLGWTPFG